jgi:hypothetical protein
MCISRVEFAISLIFYLFLEANAHVWPDSYLCCTQSSREHSVYKPDVEFNTGGLYYNSDHEACRGNWNIYFHRSNGHPLSSFVLICNFFVLKFTFIHI